MPAAFALAAAVAPVVADPVPTDILLPLSEALRVLEALEDASLALERVGGAPGLRDELATVIRLVEAPLGLTWAATTAG